MVVSMASAVEEEEEEEEDFKGTPPAIVVIVDAVAFVAGAFDVDLAVALLLGEVEAGNIVVGC